jgi:ATP adenylyltransferase
MSTAPLWAPWRIDFILDKTRREPECVLCAHGRAEPGEDGGVLGGGPLAYIVLNRYPYSTGHLMIVPRAHGGSFEALDPATAVEATRLLQIAVEATRQALRPDGFNLGMNLGEVAGAGIPGHVHWHIVPRWSGDTNFMPVLADLHVIPEHLRATWRRLAPVLEPALRAAGFGGVSGAAP